MPGGDEVLPPFPRAANGNTVFVVRLDQCGLHVGNFPQETLKVKWSKIGVVGYFAKCLEFRLQAAA